MQETTTAPPPPTTPIHSKRMRYITLTLLVLFLLTFSLSTATTVGATRTLNLLIPDPPTNPWLLPLRSKYFPFSELRAVWVISSIITLIDGLSVLVVATLAIVPDDEKGKSLIMRMAFFAAVLEIPAIVFTARKVSLVLNGHTTDRSHCGWVWVGQEGVVTVVEGILEGVVGESSSSNSVPEGFGRICRESRLATYGPLLLLVVHLLLTFVIALIATPSPKTANPAVGEDGEDRAREENQSARGFGDARAHNDGEGVKMAELQSRGVESSSLPSYSSSCSSASEPPLEGKDGDR